MNVSARHTAKFSGRTCHEIRIRNTEGQKGEPHERNSCAPRFEERTPEETSKQEECAIEAACDQARKYTISKMQRKLRSIHLWSRRPCSYPETRRNACLLLIQELQI